MGIRTSRCCCLARVFATNVHGPFRSVSLTPAWFTQYATVDPGGESVGEFRIESGSRIFRFALSTGELYKFSLSDYSLSLTGNIGTSVSTVYQLRVDDLGLVHGLGVISGEGPSGGAFTCNLDGSSLTTYHGNFGSSNPYDEFGSVFHDGTHTPTGVTNSGWSFGRRVFHPPTYPAPSYARLTYSIDGVYQGEIPTFTGTVSGISRDVAPYGAVDILPDGNLLVSKFGVHIAPDPGVTQGGFQNTTNWSTESDTAAFIMSTAGVVLDRITWPAGTTDGNLSYQHICYDLYTNRIYAFASHGLYSCHVDEREFEAMSIFDSVTWANTRYLMAFPPTL